MSVNFPAFMYDKMSLSTCENYSFQLAQCAQLIHSFLFKNKSNFRIMSFAIRTKDLKVSISHI